ncbi:hypothetical protein FGB62_251g08 [Gracilaria domingensis]|nr:hypothetical protein FGB62_251g08 [Gracilaria domingensis]
MRGLAWTLGDSRGLGGLFPILRGVSGGRDFLGGFSKVSEEVGNVFEGLSVVAWKLEMGSSWTVPAELAGKCSRGTAADPYIGSFLGASGDEDPGPVRC